MRGIISYGGYVPYRRLDRSEISAMMGAGGGRGHRSVASFDEDTTSMGVEAARLALASAGDVVPGSLLFSTVAPAYVDKTNATGVHAALRLPDHVLAMDAGGSVRSASGALRLALDSTSPTLVVAADVRTGLPTSPDEANGGDAAAAVLIGSDADGPVVAEFVGGASVTEEFTDRWRAPGERRARAWEERFGEMMYVPMAEQAWSRALDDAGLAADDLSGAVVSGLHGRAVRRVGGKLGIEVLDDLSGDVGNSGAAQGLLALTNVLDGAAPGDVFALVVLSDGVDVFVFRATDAVADHQPARSVSTQLAHRGDVPYAKFLSWRGMLEVQPPNRPEPARPSSSAASRREEWKYGFVGSRDRDTDIVHLPPARIGINGGQTDHMDPAPMADAQGTVVTFTIDKLAYSPSPPIVFAVVDFDGGGRMPIELTDVDPDGIEIGDRVEMTFRRLFTSDGIHNYFWKGRPVRA